ncbi:hypothetical protein AB0N07_02120 [Streptomyces sp. NPDC051172]|uniref:hypothetical protein n=1 Tax=Streptomyces sp. NPDC051172 TaxID=3155796 RepID=UPI003416CD59
MLRGKGRSLAFSVDGEREIPLAGQWLQQTGLDLTDGILCAPTTHVIDANGYAIDGIVAAGDVGRRPNLRFDDTPRHVEHWINAIEMGRHAPGALLQGPQDTAPFMPVPRFWSHQHGVRIQSVGMPALGTEMTVLDGAPPTATVQVRRQAAQPRRDLSAVARGWGNVPGACATATNGPQAPADSV